MEFSSLPDYEAAVVLGKGTWFTWPAWIALKLISSGVVIVDVGGRLSAATRLIIHRLVLEKEHLFYLLLRLFYLTLLQGGQSEMTEFAMSGAERFCGSLCS